MTLEELKETLGNKPISFKNLVDTLNQHVKIELNSDNINMEDIALDVETFEDYILNEKDFKKAIVDYVLDGLSAEYSILDVVKVSLK